MFVVPPLLQARLTCVAAACLPLAQHCRCHGAAVRARRCSPCCCAPWRTCRAGLSTAARCVCGGGGLEGYRPALRGDGNFDARAEREIKREVAGCQPSHLMPAVEPPAFPQTFSPLPCPSLPSGLHQGGCGRLPAQPRRHRLPRTPAGSSSGQPAGTACSGRGRDRGGGAPGWRGRWRRGRRAGELCVLGKGGRDAARHGGVKVGCALRLTALTPTLHHHPPRAPLPP